MFLPVFVFAIIFCYLPMLGIRYAFTNYNGIKEPTFVAFANFKRMFEMPGFLERVYQYPANQYYQIDFNNLYCGGCFYFLK